MSKTLDSWSVFFRKKSAFQRGLQGLVEVQRFVSDLLTGIPYRKLRKELEESRTEMAKIKSDIEDIKFIFGSEFNKRQRHILDEYKSKIINS